MSKIEERFINGYNIQEIPEKKKIFSKIYQGKEINTLAKTKTNTKDKNLLNPLGELKIVDADDNKIIIEKYEELRNGLRDTAKQLLDLVIIKITETNISNNIVKIPLKEYQKIKNVLFIDKLREQIKEDLEALFNTKISFNNSKGKRTSFLDMRICTSKGIEKGIINYGVSNEFLALLKSCAIMPYPIELIGINTNNNPNSFYFGRKISEHKNMNFGKTNEDTISFKTLIESSPNMTKYEDVKKFGGIEKRIIEPFERDLDALKFIKWNYCGKNGEIIQDEVLEKATYHDYEKFNIKITWLEYPNRIVKIKDRKPTKKQPKKV